MALIGRKRELALLDRCLESQRPEFVTIYGRRRVGKTFLVREYFKDQFSFYATGIADEGKANQLRTFGMSLARYGYGDASRPADWFEAFDRLRDLLSSDRVTRDRASGRRVIFLDELPWFDTPRSSFKAALDWFWNGWASSQPDVLLLVCGSATSWIIDNLLDDRGGFFNRVTTQIHLAPFTLAESEQLLRANGIELSRQQVIECYMVFGGVPHYLNLIDRRSSLAQNIDQLCFDPHGGLRFELDRLTAALFKHSAIHEAILRSLSETGIGRTRAELAAKRAIGDGKALTKALRELEQCGFVRRYHRYGKKKVGHYYQLVDPFTRFSMRFMEGEGPASWLNYVGSPGHRAWTGIAFELVCLHHVRQMKRALGIESVHTEESAWKSDRSEPGAQVDLVIDRQDGIINLCEMKFAMGDYVIDAGYERTLRNKLDAFATEAKPGKTLHLTLVSPNGVVRNAHAGILTNEIVADDLFS